MLVRNKELEKEKAQNFLSALYSTKKGLTLVQQKTQAISTLQSENKSVGQCQVRCEVQVKNQHFHEENVQALEKMNFPNTCKA